MTWCHHDDIKKHNVKSATNIIKIKITVIQQLPLKTIHSHLCPHALLLDCLTGAQFL